MAGKHCLVLDPYGALPRTLLIAGLFIPPTVILEDQEAPATTRGFLIVAGDVSHRTPSFVSVSQLQHVLVALTQERLVGFQTVRHAPKEFQPIGAIRFVPNLSQYLRNCAAILPST